MGPRKTWTTLPGAKPAPKAGGNKNRKRGREDRMLDAYAIAEKQYGDKVKMRKHRLGDINMDSESSSPYRRIELRNT